jgi:hypothetical protein
VRSPTHALLEPSRSVPVRERLHVVGIRDDDAGEAPVLVIEDVAQRATSDS